MLKDNNIMLLVVLLVLISLLFGCGGDNEACEGDDCPVDSEYDRVVCVDTDNGIVAELKGSAQIVGIKEIVDEPKKKDKEAEKTIISEVLDERNDKCVGNTVKEWSCNEDEENPSFVYEYVDCYNVCADGHCLQSPPGNCVDTDMEENYSQGKNYYVGGITTYEGTNIDYYDFCEEGKLHEFHCSDKGFVDENVILCESINKERPDCIDDINGRGVCTGCIDYDRMQKDRDWRCPSGVSFYNKKIKQYDFLPDACEGERDLKEATCTKGNVLYKLDHNNNYVLCSDSEHDGELYHGYCKTAKDGTAYCTDDWLEKNMPGWPYVEGCEELSKIK